MRKSSRASTHKNASIYYLTLVGVALISLPLFGQTVAPVANTVEWVKSLGGEVNVDGGMVTSVRVDLGNADFSLSSTPLAGLTDVKKLSLSGRKDYDLSPLAALPQLESLELDLPGTTDISPLANLPHLQQLSLHCSHIGDLTPLAKLTKLTQLDIDCSEVTDITPLANLNRYQKQISDTLISPPFPCFPPPTDVRPPDLTPFPGFPLRASVPP